MTNLVLRRPGLACFTAAKLAWAASPVAANGRELPSWHGRRLAPPGPALGLVSLARTRAGTVTGMRPQAATGQHGSDGLDVPAPGGPPPPSRIRVRLAAGVQAALAASGPTVQGQ